GEKWVITFSVKAACDATVAVHNKEGKVIRHLGSGVLGKNAPYPFQQNALTQKLLWDGKDDDGQPAPAGCTVKVSLGLEARFEKLEQWALTSGIRPVAISPQGELFVACRSDGITGTLDVFSPEGKYQRTILPPPVAPDLPTADRFRIIQWNKTTTGKQVPRMYRNGGGFNFELARFNNFSTTIQQGVFLPDGRLCIVNAPNRKGQSLLLLLDAKDGSCGEKDIVTISDVITDGLTVSPDGKWLYFAGRAAHPWDKSILFSHAVLRMALNPPGRPEVFLGDPAKSSTDEMHFNGPSQIDCDQNGNLYVADTGNKRLQIYKPDRSFIKSLPLGKADRLVGVSRKTGAIYLWRQESWQKNPVIIKLAGMNNPAKVAELEIRGEGEWRDHQQAAILAAEADPPRIWFTGVSYAGKPFAVAIEDRGDRLEPTIDLVRANPTTTSAGHLTAPGSWHSLHVDRRTGDWVWDHPIGPDGLRYQRSQYYAAPKGTPYRMWIIRYDPKTGDYVPFTHGEPAGRPDPAGRFGGSPEPFTHRGKPVIGIAVPLANGSHLHQGPFSVAPNGDIYVSGTYSKEFDKELEAAGLPRLNFKGGLGDICAPVLRVYDRDGKLKSVCALPGLGELEGLRVGRSGAIYVVQPFRPIGQKLPEGLAEGDYDPSRWGTLMKFPGDFRTFPVGRIEGAWEGVAPKSPTHESIEFKVKVHGALWTYGGVSPHSGSYRSCTCLRASSDLDDFERSFVCAAQTCTINVIDSNGNVMARLGGFGTVGQMLAGSKKGDSQKESSTAGRPLLLILPRNVAATDDAMWVADLNQRALIKAALIYRTEAVVALPTD
ncbi:MAG: hypothetical protein RMJ52_11560, partial [Gemmataceae bacterium]|nr:hypothetical protein [Gemmataceae bacterium]